MSFKSQCKLLDELLSNTRQVFFIQDAFTEHLNFIYVNNAYEILWGRSKESLLANPLSYIDAIHPNDKNQFISLYRSFFDGDLEYEKEFTFRIIKNDGTIRWVYSKSWAIFNTQGQLYRLAGVSEDITDRKKAEMDVIHHNEIQSDVIKMLAHDLRTPIAGIKLTASLLTNSTDANVRVYQNQIIDMCTNTMLMMDDLLSHIQISSNGFRINLTRLKIEEELREVCKNLEVQFLSKNITIILPQSETYLELDSVKFTQIVSNLVTNAIKFSYPDGTISIYVNDREEYVDLVIKDNGIGISKESLPDVFDVFTSARRIGTNEESSTGLGLSIVKKLVGILNAKIYITNESPEGTEVKVVFRKKIN
tara:strand:- start:284 stop:1375 length:1092 start_codon:yes stop_codon:yes gene_type:complete